MVTFLSKSLVCSDWSDLGPIVLYSFWLDVSSTIVMKALYMVFVSDLIECEKVGLCEN